jgi:hypothetical protein
MRTGRGRKAAKRELVVSSSIAGIEVDQINVALLVKLEKTFVLSNIFFPLCSNFMEHNLLIHGGKTNV